MIDVNVRQSLLQILEEEDDDGYAVKTNQQNQNPDTVIVRLYDWKETHCTRSSIDHAY